METDTIYVQRRAVAQAWSIVALLLLTSLVYAWLGSGYQVFIRAEYNLSAADSRKMAAVLKNPKKLEKMLLVNVLKSPKDHMAWQWLARLYVSQKRWPEGQTAAKKAYHLSKSVQDFMLWAHTLQMTEDDELMRWSQQIDLYRKQYPEYADVWQQLSKRQPHH